MPAFWRILGLSILILSAVPATRAADVALMTTGDIKALQQRLTDDACYQGPIDGQASPALDAAIKACPTQDPILRIETGMHLDPSPRIGVDQACRIASTGSSDKTVRVWSLPDGRLLRTLRVPIGPGNVGKIAATAISPDGHWIVAGGWDGVIYVFDASAGTLASRVGIRNSIDRLAFSSDGHWLVASTGTGFAAINAQTWQIVAEDESYGGPSYGAAFGPDGRLYTVAYDGTLKRYGGGLKREVLTRGGRQPYAVAVDPTGQLVAVGFYDSTKVDVYDAASLKFRFAADTRGVDNGNFIAVAWSNDGAHLFAGGDYWIHIGSEWKRVLLTFDRDGKRIGDPLPLSDNLIFDLRPCGDALAVSVADPAFGLVAGNGQIKLWKTGVAPNMGEKIGDAFTVARNAKQVRFGLGYGADEPVLFDLGRATVTDAPNPLPGLLAPSTQGLPISNWEDKFSPIFAGKPIQLAPYETSRSLAIRADRSGFVLGTEWFLRAYDAQGRQLWAQAIPDVAWGVNLSADGRVIVVAYADGTVRWQRWSDGKELLALFVDRKDKRWVAWTPSGYYMASPGGEDLIGWHVNRGWNQAADFFPASRFRARFNRPDIVRLVLDTLDEGAAIKQANDAAKRKEDTRPLIAHLPPVLEILDPADGTHVASGTATLHYAYRSPSGQPVDRIEVLLNGRPVKEIGLPIHPLGENAETRGSVDVSLAQRASEVGLIAWNGTLASEAARVRLTWDNAPAPAAQARKLFALVVGVSDYADPGMKLAYAAKDARDFAQALEDQKGIYYADVETRVLTDRNVTRTSVLEGLQWLDKTATGPDDISVLFLAGHGLTDDKQTYWFFPSDATVDNVEINGVSQDEIRRSLEKLSGKVLWFLDTCHAGTAAKRPPVDMSVLVNTVASTESGGIVVFASSTGREVSAESSQWGNGAFTKAILEGIEEGKAAFLQGLITTSSLDLFVENRVQQLTAGQQNPVMERPPEEPDFAIAEAHKP